MALEGFESSVGGNWILLRNENLDDFLAAMGIGYIRRKIACAFSNQVELRKTGDKQIRIISTGPKDYDHTVTLDEPTEKEDPFDNIVRAVVSWDSVNCVMTSKVEPLTPKGKRCTVTRRIINNELVVQIVQHEDNIVCKRFFKKVGS